MTDEICLCGLGVELQVIHDKAVMSRLQVAPLPPPPPPPATHVEKWQHCEELTGNFYLPPICVVSGTMILDSCQCNLHAI